MYNNSFLFIQIPCHKQLKYLFVHNFVLYWGFLNDYEKNNLPSDSKMKKKINKKVKVQ